LSIPFIIDFLLTLFLRHKFTLRVTLSWLKVPSYTLVILEDPVGSLGNGKMVLFIAALSAIVALTSASPVATQNFAVGQTVKTSSGVITGHAAKNRTEVSEYLGIPFAKPPVGDLRWKAPVKYVGDAPINASSYVSSTLNRRETLLTRI
jgi:hypothetical protein